MTGKRQCYACGALATGEDHVPPRGFYPKPREIFRGPRTGPNFRTKLIKVPSCDAHNNARSKDDGYTQGLIITMSAFLKDDLNPDTRPPFVDQWIERLGRGRRLRAWIDSGEPCSTPDGEMVATTADAAAVARVLEATARGLYFHHHGGIRRWPDRCQILVPHFSDAQGRHPAESPLGELNAAFAARHERGDAAGKKRGPHPTIFYYQMAEKERQLLAMRLVFYGAFVAFALRRPGLVSKAFDFCVDGGPLLEVP